MADSSPRAAYGDGAPLEVIADGSLEIEKSSVGVVVVLVLTVLIRSTPCHGPLAVEASSAMRRYGVKVKVKVVSTPSDNC